MASPFDNRLLLTHTSPPAGRPTACHEKEVVEPLHLRRERLSLVNVEDKAHVLARHGLTAGEVALDALAQRVAPLEDGPDTFGQAVLHLHLLVFLIVLVSALLLSRGRLGGCSLLVFLVLLVAVKVVIL